MTSGVVDALRRNAQRVKELTEQAVEDGGLSEISLPGTSGMAVIGERFKNNEVYVPEVLIAARAMKAGMAIIKPLLVEANVEPIGRVVIGTVKGDLHDIGKNLVGMMLEGAGFEVIDVGVDVAPEKFVSVAKEKNAKLIGLSALLTTTMPSMRDTLDKLESEGVRSDIKMMIGGAPVTQRYADEIGADGYAPDASSAVDLAKSLLGIALDRLGDCCAGAEPRDFPSCAEVSVLYRRFGAQVIRRIEIGKHLKWTLPTRLLPSLMRRLGISL